MITDKDITVVRLPEDPENPFDAITFEAHLRLSSRHMIAPDSIDLERDPVKVKAMVEDNLRKRILHHVYGDLRKPLNALLDIALAQHDAPVSKIMTIRDTLKDIL